MSPSKSKSKPHPHSSLAPEARQAGRRHLAFSFLYGVLAIVVYDIGENHQGIFGHNVKPKAVEIGAAVVFVFLGTFATRRIARALGALMTARTARAAGAAVRLLVTAVGYVVVVFGTLTLLGVNVQRLLVGGTIAGVVIGIAAQQSLGNIFAGFVLQFARPFTIGDNIRVRAGALNGPFDGVVLGMSLTYVTMFTEGGVLKVPNSGMLAAAVGLYPAKDRSVVDAARAAGAPFTPPQGTMAVPGPGIAPVPGAGGASASPASAGPAKSASTAPIGPANNPAPSGGVGGDPTATPPGTGSPRPGAT